MNLHQYEQHPSCLLPYFKVLLQSYISVIVRNLCLIIYNTWYLVSHQQSPNHPRPSLLLCLIQPWSAPHSAWWLASSPPASLIEVPSPEFMLNSSRDQCAVVFPEKSGFTKIYIIITQYLILVLLIMSSDISPCLLSRSSSASQPTQSSARLSQGSGSLL